MKIVVILMISALTTASNCTSGQQCSSCEDSTGHCTTECFTGFYGPRCNISCSEGCKDSVCILNKVGTEKCVAGCNAGFYGIRCSIPCSFDEKCHKCPQECEEGFCQLESTCVSGCNDSFYGRKCRSCGSDCDDCDRRTGICLGNRTSNDTGEVLQDTLQGWFFTVMLTSGVGISSLMLLTILLIVFLRLKRMRRRNEQPSRSECDQAFRLEGTDGNIDPRTCRAGSYIHAVDDHYDECNTEEFL